MDEYSTGEKIARAIAKQLDTAFFSPTTIAGMLSKQPGIIQFRLWKIIVALIEMWAIDARYEQYDPQYVQVYKWAERKANDASNT